MSAMSIIAQALLRLSRGNTKLPRNMKFEFSPYILVSIDNTDEIHQVISLGQFIPLGLSVLSKEIWTEAVSACLKAQALANRQRIGMRSIANQSQPVGMSHTFVTNSGNILTISVGGVPEDEAAFFIVTLASYLREAKLLEE